jgi:gamma-glutamylcyclotransferase (GGCT)/AIG2-like uncharacterized protein YtfP
VSDLDCGVETRLATYGSLSPGEINHSQLSGLQGRWLKGRVRGYLRNAGWGSSMGFPGLALDPGGPEVNVNVFESSELPNHWLRLDEFEGSEYRRVETHVETEDGVIEANIYVVAL